MHYYQLRQIGSEIAFDVIVGVFGTVVVLFPHSLAIYGSISDAVAALGGGVIDPVDPPAEKKAALAKRLRLARRHIEDVLADGSATTLPSVEWSGAC